MTSTTTVVVTPEGLASMERNLGVTFVVEPVDPVALVRITGLTVNVSEPHGSA